MLSALRDVISNSIHALTPSSSKKKSQAEDIKKVDEIVNESVGENKEAEVQKDSPSEDKDVPCEQKKEISPPPPVTEDTQDELSLSRWE